MLNRLDGLERMLDRHSVLLTPASVPTRKPRSRPIVDNEDLLLEARSLQPGFSGRADDRARTSFIDWWADRLRQLLL